MRSILGQTTTNRNSARGVKYQQNIPAHATVEKDDERRTVLLVHICHDAEHPGPGDARREHNARCIVINEPSIAHTSVHTKHEAWKLEWEEVRGRRLFLLFFIFLLLPADEEEEVAHLRQADHSASVSERPSPTRWFSASIFLSFSSSSSFFTFSSSLSFKPVAVRKRSVAESTASPAASAKDGGLRDAARAGRVLRNQLRRRIL